MDKSLSTFGPASLPNPTALRYGAGLGKSSRLWPSSHRNWGGALKIFYLGNIGTTLPCATLRPIRHWGSPPGWRGSRVHPGPRLPPAGLGGGLGQQHPQFSLRGCLEDWDWGLGLVLCPPSSKETLGSTVSCWGFHCPGSQAGHTFCFPILKVLRDTIC